MDQRKKIDEVDRRIIAALRANAREPISSLARRVGLARSTVQERLARLERSGAIAGYTVRLHVPKAAVTAYLLVYLRGPVFEVEPLIEAIPEVTKSQSLGGEFDIILQVETNDIQRLNDVRNEVEAMPGVAKVRTGIVLADGVDRTG